MNASDIKAYWQDQARHYARACKAHLQRVLGIPCENPVSECAVTTHTYSSDREQWECWAADAMRLAWGDAVNWPEHPEYVLRGLLLAQEYRGRAGGFLPGHLADSLLVLRSYAEHLIRGAL